jgi:hypothetical protein
MDWSGGRNARLLAGADLGSWVSWLVGVVWTLIIQLLTNAGPPQPVIAGVLFFVGVLGVTALAYVLRDRVPKQAGRLMASATDYQRAWQRMMLGLELGRAWRALAN